jgi:hypothetical protein
MAYGNGGGVDKESVNVSMKKVMGASANASVSKANNGGGKIQKPGQYTAKTIAMNAETVSANKSGFNGKSEPTQKYQGK